MEMKRIWRFLRVLACLIPLAESALAQGQASTAGSSSTPDPGLVSALTKQLNVTPEQATGGAGALFGLAKNNLSAADFSQVSAAVPGMNGFLKAAPATAGQSASAESSSKSGSTVSSAMSSITGGGTADATSQVPGAAGAAGGLMSLAPAFQKLGLSPAMASQFAPVMQNYVAKKGGPKVASLLGGAWK